MMSFDEVFEILMESILKKNSVQIKYLSASNEYTERKIMPKKFVLVERRNTYSQICLEAYCYLREDDRIFAVYRIEEIND